MSSLFHEFEARVHEDPSRTAVRSVDGRTTSYGRLASTVLEVRELLSSGGVRPGTVVRITGCLNASAVAVMLASWELEAIVWLVDAPEPPAKSPGTVACTAPILVDVHTGADTLAVATATSVSYLDADSNAAVHDIASHSGRPGDRPGYVVRSSGSMGAAKYILGSYAGLSKFVTWQRDTFRVGPSDSVAHVTNVTFDVVFRELLTPLVSGAVLLLPPQSSRPGTILRHLVSSGATIVNLVPSVARMWLNTSEADPIGQAHGACLRLTFFAGEPLDSALAVRWRKRMGSQDGVVNLYGPSETTLAKFYWMVPDDFAAPVCPVGEPIPGTAFALVDPETNKPTRPEDVGEVVIETDQASYGYIGPGAAQRNLAFGGDDRATTFKTGDLGRRNGASLELVGRVDATMKINGRWVDRAAVEVVLRGLDDVVDAVVLPMRTPSGLRVQAFVSAPTVVDRGRLRRAISRTLGTASVPSAIVELPEFPRLRTGKIDIAKLMWMRLNDQRKGENMIDDGSAEGRFDNSAESLLQFILKHASVAVGREVLEDSDLFDLGLDSLSALEISAAIEEHYPVECSPEDVFEHPVIAELAQLLLQRA